MQRFYEFISLLNITLILKNHEKYNSLYCWVIHN